MIGNMVIKRKTYRQYFYDKKFTIIKILRSSDLNLLIYGQEANLISLLGKFSFTRPVSNIRA